MRATLVVVDGPPVDVYGFPFAWHWLSGVSSLEQVIRVPALLADLAVYTAASAFAVARFAPSGAWYRRVVIAAWAGAALAIGLAFVAFVAFSHGTSIGELPSHDGARYSIAFGPFT